VDDETRVRGELVRQQQDARATIHRGVVMLAMVPLTILGAIVLALTVHSVTATVLAFLGTAAYALIGSIGGLAMMTSGAVDHRRIGKQLRDLDAPRQLPTARVVVR
jgi:hypothetical protein